MDTPADPRRDRLAVNLIEKLCFDVGCAVNSAEDDRNGWDLIVEFPVPPHRGPADTRLPALKCFVQVKSTQTDTASVRIKLSNALSLAKNPLPCFTVLVMYADDGKTPTKIYLQHFDKPQIARALKAARQAHADGEIALNQKSVTLGFTPEELTPESEVASRMVQAVPSPASYGAAKDAYVRDVGYESGYGRGKLSFALEHVDAFVDAMLGKETEVPVESISFRGERFGIIDPEPLFDGSGKIRITPKSMMDCRVVIRLPNTSDKIVLPGEIFVPGIPGLPDEYRKIRIRTDILEFTCGVGEERNVKFGDFTASFETDERTSIDRVDQFAALWSWFETGPLELELWVDGKRFIHGQIEAKDKQDQRYWRALRRVTRTFAKFVDKELRPPKMAFALSDFTDLSTALQFIGVIEGAAATLRVGTDVNEFPADLRTYITPIFLEFGSVLFFAVAKYRIKEAVINNGVAVIELVDPTILRRSILPGTLANNAEFAREEIAAVEKLCAQKGEHLVASFQPEALGISGS